MKVLRIYNHLGELEKEFNLYVVGEDFKWQASVPEVVWLGTITLEDAGKEPEKPSESVSEPLQPEPEVIEEETEEDKQVKADNARKEREIRAMEVKDAPKKSDRKRSRVKRATSPASPESTERLPQNDSPGDSPEGD